jgi:glycerophosphoryl diester phosphodiesterase
MWWLLGLAEGEGGGAGRLWLLALGAYCALSTLLLYRPQLLSWLRPRKPDVAFSVRYGAHRGGAGERVENTMAAFSHAVRCGCSLLELDVRLTADRQVAVIHDANMLRTTGKDVAVSSCAFADLPLAMTRLPAPPPFSAAGVVTSVQQPAAGSEEEREQLGVPLLRDVLRRFPQCVVNVDLKEDSDALLQEAERVIEREQAWQRVIWGSFSHRMQQEMARRRPDSHLFFSARAVLQLYAAYFTGLLPFLSLQAQYLEIPFITASVRPAFVSRLTPALGPRAASLAVSLLSWLGRRRALFSHLSARGVHVIVWVVNSEAELRSVLELTGAAGVMTDFPSRLQQLFGLQGPRP